MSSCVTDIRSLKTRPLGGLDVEKYYQTQTRGTHDEDWIYRYAFSDIINTYSDSSDILKVTSVMRMPGSRALSYTQIERYFLTKSNGRAVALCRRIVSPEEPPILQSYVIGLDKVLSQKYRSRVYPFSTRRSFDNYKQHCNDTFTPIVFRPQDLSSPHHYMIDEGTYGPMEWLDKIALQGWFPSHVLYTLALEPPEHTGWSVQSGYIPEIMGTITRQNSVRLEYGSEMSQAIARTVGESILHDYRVCVEVDSDYGRDIPKIVDFQFYDPKEGQCYDIAELGPEGAREESNLILNFIDETIGSMRGESRGENFDTITMYRCLNDLIYLILRQGDRNVGHMVFDFSKHLLVHYGFIDIPIAALE